MKDPAFVSWKAISAALLMAVVLRAPADPGPNVPGAEKSYTGMVISVNTNENVFCVQRRLWSAKQFAYGDNCDITLLYSTLKNGLGSTTSGGLRSGERVTVNYQDFHGVHIADRIEQRPMQSAGTIKLIDPEKHWLVLHRRIGDKQLEIAAGCITILGDQKAGTLADIGPGDHVVVIYETPGGTPMAWQITKTSPAARAR
jgi:hypothetical protein